MANTKEWLVLKGLAFPDENNGWVYRNCEPGDIVTGISGDDIRALLDQEAIADPKTYVPPAPEEEPVAETPPVDEEGASA
jgi:hypothetical protein